MGRDQKSCHDVSQYERLFQSLDELLDIHTRLLNTPRLTFAVKQAEVSISYLDIVSICTAEKNYLEISDADGRNYETRMTFAAAEKQLSADDRFLTLTRGVIVNLDHVTGMDAETCTMSTGTVLPLNVRSGKQIRQAWQNYLLRQTRREDEDRRLNGC